MLHEEGVFVFESKNYSGWIFGGTEQRQWTQCLANKDKRKFYNPVMQNITHINALIECLKIQPGLCKSYIVFSERCTLKTVPEDTENYRILRRSDMLHKLELDVKARKNVLAKEQIDDMYEKLILLTQVTTEQKQNHVDRIRQQVDINDNAVKNNVCPQCGGKLVERNGQYGKFMGCSNYPRCKYILNIERK